MALGSSVWFPGSIFTLLLKASSVLELMVSAHARAVARRPHVLVEWGGTGTACRSKRSSLLDVLQYHPPRPAYNTLLAQTACRSEKFASE